MKEYLETWWGEGEVKMYLDGDKVYPTLCGTGTEDYIGTGYGQGVYNHLYQGCTVADNKENKYAFYRYHIPDPVYFHSDLRVTIQQICWVGSENVIKEFARMKTPLIFAGEKSETVDFSKKVEPFIFERSDDVASCAYFYLSEPENNLNQVPRLNMDSSIMK